MTNPYFSSYSALPRNQLARAEALNAIFDAIIVGFNGIPDATALNQDRLTYCTDSGIAGAYVIAPATPIVSYIAGQRFSFIATHANAGASTVNVSALGVKTIKRQDGTDLQANDITVGRLVWVQYDGTVFQLMSMNGSDQIAAAASAATASVAAATAAASAASPFVSAGQAAASAAAAAASAITATGVFTYSGSFAGIGRTPLTIFDVKQDQNSGTVVRATNASAGAAAYCSVKVDNGTHTGDLTVFGASFTTSGANRQGGVQLHATGPGGLTFLSDLDGMYFYVGANRFMVSDGTAVDVVAGSSNGVRLSSGGTVWNAISDYRAKDLYGEFTNSGAIIDAVPVHLAQLKNKTQPLRPMFLAHEVAEGGAGYAVHGEKDGEEMQRLDTTDPFIPVMWAEIRSLRNRMAIQEARHEAQ